MSGIEDFKDLVGESEIGPGHADSSVFEQAFGFALPADYLSWAMEYPTLEICEEFFVRNLISDIWSDYAPSDIADSLDPIKRIRSNEETRHTVYDAAGLETGPKSWPPIYPEANGMIPWGSDSMGTVYLWDARPANPDEWTVISFDGSWREFECGFVEFLVRLLRGEYMNSPMFIRNWPYLPAIREFESNSFEGGGQWHVPERWAGYFDELHRRRSDIKHDWSDLSWVAKFKQP